MPYCVSCGKQIPADSFFCPFCGKAVERSPQAQNSQTVQSNSYTYNQKASHTMYESFAPKWGLGGKMFVFTENSLIYGNVEYPYSQLGRVELISMPTNQFTNGTAQVMANGKILDLAYEIQQKERFLSAVAYANEQIDLAHGTKRDYKYLLQTSNGSKLEVYEDYFVLHYVESAFSVAAGNTANGKIVRKFLSIGDVISIQLVQATAVNGKSIQLAYTENGKSNCSIIPVEPKNIETATEIVSFIDQKRQEGQGGVQSQADEEDFGKVVGEEKIFTLSEKALRVPENMDAFNTYRLSFRKLAMKYADRAEKEYRARVYDLDSFVELFPKIYVSNLEPLLKTAVDIFISEDIWNVTYDYFRQQYTDEFHQALDIYNITVQSIEMTVQDNQKLVSDVMGVVPHFVGGGFGLRNALRGAAKATAFNLFRDGIESGITKNTNIRADQKRELYERIRPQDLFDNLFLDYWMVFVTLVKELNKNGKDIWLPDDEMNRRASDIFENISNPKFPQDKVLDVILEILEMNPYEREYHKFIAAQFGETEEVSAIKDYFGYADFDNPRVI